MAEELVDRVIQEKALDKVTKVGPCVTKGIKLVGGDGYHDLLYVQLIQKYGVSEHIAKHLCHTYGAAAFAVCEQRTKDPKKAVPVGKVLVEGYPFIEAEVEYAANNEYAVTVKDMLTLRMRLAYLNSEAAKHAIPRVAELMGDALGWSSRERKRQIEEAKKYIGEFGGPLANKKNARLKAQTYTDLLDMFHSIDTDANGYIDENELERAATKLGFPFKTKGELKAAFTQIDKDGNGRITEGEFIEWWNASAMDSFSKKLHMQLTMTAENEVAIDKLLLQEDKRKG